MPRQAVDFLPRPADFLQQLFSSLNSVSAESDHVKARAAIARPQLLTLHALFPNSFIPALDLLDRGFVIRLLTDHSINPFESDITSAQTAPTDAGNSEAGSGADITAPPDTSDQHNTAPRPHTTGLQRKVYYVQSQQYPATRGRRATSRLDIQHYEVRLQAWNCTCAAFVFAAFNTTNENSNSLNSFNYDDNSELRYSASGRGIEDPLPEGSIPAASWGGFALNEESVPVCKHLLACVLCEHWDIAAEMVHDRAVGKAEAAGWAAGGGLSGSFRGD